MNKKIGSRSDFKLDRSYLTKNRVLKQTIELKTYSKRHLEAKPTENPFQSNSVSNVR